MEKLDNSAADTPSGLAMARTMQSPSPAQLPPAQQHDAAFGGLTPPVTDWDRYELLKPLESMNAFVTWAAVALAAAQLLFFWNFFASLRSGRAASLNPWGAESLEWSPASSQAPVSEGEA